MMKRVASLALLAGSLVLSYTANAGPTAPEKWGGAKPMFATLPPHGYWPSHAPTAHLVQWDGGFTDNHGHAITFVMAGKNPSKSNGTTKFTTWIIPVIMKYGTSNGNMTFDPKSHKLSNGKTVIKNVLASPLFDDGIDFVQGGTDLGQAQYIDAFQRGNFWSLVSTNTAYHTVLAGRTSKSLPPLTIDVSASQGAVEDNPFGSGMVGTMDINAFDSALQTYLSAHSDVITPATLPLFVSFDIYLTSGGCCIGGYHSANSRQPNGQTYSYSTYVDTVGAFSQDVSAISHELGEWMDDPFTDNRVYCHDNSILEVGDPLEGKPNYGGFPYDLNGFTYNLQSLVFLGYFGAPRSTSVNSWLSFQNDETHVCPGQ